VLARVACVMRHALLLVALSIWVLVRVRVGVGACFSLSKYARLRGCVFLWFASIVYCSNATSLSVFDGMIVCHAWLKLQNVFRSFRMPDVLSTFNGDAIFRHDRVRIS
jgi:hypothetical protein